MIKMAIPEKLQIKGTNTARFDLKRFLIPGGAAINVKSKAFVDFKATCDWSAVDPQRLTFITECFHAINSFDSVATREDHTANLKRFVAWCDKNHKKLAFDKDAFKKLYLAYDNFYYDKASDKEIKITTAKGYMVALSALADRVFDTKKLTKGTGLTAHSRCVKAYKRRAPAAGSLRAEKQSFSDTQAFGYYCVDVCRAITTENLLAPLPFVYTSEETGQQYQFPWDTTPLDELSKKDQWDVANKPHTHKSRRPTDSINGEPKRTSLAKMRIFAEFMVFLFQTGLNLSQALQLKRERFKYTLQGETEWHVTYKPRAGRMRSFPIFKQYKDWFKAYLAFCDQHFPDDDYLFPAITQKSRRRSGQAEASTFKNYIKAHNIPWMPPSKIRNTRANYLLRISGDPERTAQVHGHGVATMKQYYMRPSQQRSASALTAFWKDYPVSQIESGCDRQPQAVIDKPDDVVEPDCIHASGCLWCEKHRDIESFDYVWNLSSFKHLKLIEAGQLKKGGIPADKSIKRCIEKLDAFKEEKEEYADWVKEAQLRVDEGNYHPTWKGLIDFKEAT